MLLEKNLEELCQVALTLGYKSSREKRSEIKLFKYHHSVRGVAHAGPENFPVTVTRASAWFQRLSAVGRRCSKGFGKVKGFHKKHSFNLRTVYCISKSEYLYIYIYQL